MHTLKDKKFNATKTIKSTYRERKFKYLTNEKNHRLKTGENNSAHISSVWFFPQKSSLTCIIYRCAYHQKYI